MKTLLGAKSWFSSGVGVLSPDELVKAAKAAGYEHLIVAEEGELAGEHEWLRASQEHGIRITPGVELYTAYRDLPARRVTYYPQGDQGLETLHKLTSAASAGNDFPIIDLGSADLTDVSVGTGGRDGYLYDFWLTNRAAELAPFLEYLGARADRVLLEIDLTPRLLGIAPGLRRAAPSLPAIPRYPQTFAQHGDIVRRAAAEIGAYQRTASSPQDATGLFRSVEDLMALIKGVFDSVEVENWLKIARGVNPARWTGPVAGAANLRPGETASQAQEKLRSYCHKRLEDKLRAGALPADQAPAYRERLGEELRLTSQLQAAPYFLTIAGYCRRCHEAKITTRARGSGAASLILLLCDVTTADPVALRLPLTRFLNLARPGLPDIDLDIQADRIAAARALADEHLGGALRLRQLQSWTVRDSLRHVMTCLAQPEVDSRLKEVKAQLVTKEWPRTWKEFQRDPAYKSLEKKYARHFPLARELCGMPRGFTLHAASVGTGQLLEPGRLPMTFTRGEKEGPPNLTPALSYQDCVRAGLLKYDLLPSPYLSFLVKLHARLFPGDPKPHWRVRGGLDRNEESERLIRAVLGNGFTTGIFQMGSPAARQLCQQLKPGTLDEISQANALLRLTSDGGSEPVRAFLAGRKVPAILQALVGETRGVFLFQEQLMEAGVRLAGFTPEESDRFRQAVTKQRRELLEPLRRRLHHSLLETHLLSPTEADRITRQVTGSRYTFNKAHCDCYAQLIGRAALYKAAEPEAFALEYLAHLRSPPGAGDPFPSEGAKKDEMARCIYEARSLGARIDFSRWQNGTHTTLIRLGEGRTLSLGPDILPILKREDLDLLAGLQADRPASGRDAAQLALARGLAPGKMASLILCGWFDDGESTLRGDLVSLLPKPFGREVEALLHQGLAQAEAHVLGFATDRSHPGLPTQEGSVYPYQLPAARYPVTIVGYLHRPVRVDGSGRLLSLSISTLLGDPPLEVDFSLPIGAAGRETVMSLQDGEAPVAAEIARRPAQDNGTSLSARKITVLNRDPLNVRAVAAFTQSHRLSPGGSLRCH